MEENQMSYLPGQTILATTRQIDFPDFPNTFRLLRGQLVSYMGKLETPAGWRLVVMCPDGKRRLVHADEVQEHDLVASADNIPSPAK